MNERQHWPALPGTGAPTIEVKRCPTWVRGYAAWDLRTACVSNDVTILS